MFKILILASFLAVSSAYLNHGPAIINHPNYGLYHGGYQVREHGYDGNYAAPGIIPLHGKAPLADIQKLGHTGYAYAPARNFAIHQQAPAIVPQIHPHAYTGQFGPVGHSVGHFAPVGHVGHLGPIGHIGHVGAVGHVGHPSHLGHVGHINPVGHPGHTGYHSGVQGSYVVPPSVTFNQKSAQQIHPVAPVSNAVRIPYAYPVINSPQPVSHSGSHPVGNPIGHPLGHPIGHPVSHPNQSPVHGW